MENLTYCGCNPDLPSSQSLAERLAICGTCDKAATCFYPQTITLRMVKNEQESTEEPRLNLQELAQKYNTFADFHRAVSGTDEKQHKQPTNDDFNATEEESTENLQDVARSSRDFADFHNKISQKQDRVDPPQNAKDVAVRDHYLLHREPEGTQKNLRQIVQESMTFSDFHERATENDKLPPIKEKKQNLQELARGSMTFNDYHAKAEQER